MTEGTQNSAAEAAAANAVVNKAAVVTGASTGIGEATVRALRQEGWRVFAVARRAGRLEALAAETGAVALPADVTDDADVARLLETVTRAGGVDTLINIAGGARGADKVAEARTEDWEWMYDVNVLGTLKLTRAFLPMLRACGEGTVLNLTSTAALSAYEGGGGYNAAKFAQHALTGALRLEEAEHNLRVIEVAPGMVQTEEFSLNRLGDQGAADKVYAGVEKPLTAGDVADVVRYAVTAPHHVNLDQIVIRPVAQAANFKVIRKG
jgi:NADP-dependent 3-hydroxy acid dehydrogenase YdfG